MFKTLEEIFKIKITDENLYKKALTHPSFTKENNISSLENYERLEFFGDSVLKLAVSEKLVKRFENKSEGDLSKIRSILISDEILSQITEEIKLTDLIILGKHAEKAGERNRESIKACVFEALLGAFYLDNKKEEIINFLIEIFEPYMLNAIENLSKYNAKELLQEYTQSISKELPKYRCGFFQYGNGQHRRTCRKVKHSVHHEPPKNAGETGFNFLLVGRAGYAWQV